MNAEQWKPPVVLGDLCLRCGTFLDPGRDFDNHGPCRRDESAAERAARSASPVDREDELAREFIHVRGAHNPVLAEVDEADQEVRPCAWCRLAASQAVEALSRLATRSKDPSDAR